MSYWNWLQIVLKHRQMLWVLLLVNGFGTMYGFYWYHQQLLATPWYYWPFVPDSPMASLFFTLVIAAFLFGRKWLYSEALAAVTLVKYGIWACIMIIWTAMLGGELSWQHYMLLISHGGMALQALLFIPQYSFRLKHLALVAIWTLMNDLLDYSLDIFPWLSQLLHPYLPIIATLTVSLSIMCILVFYLFVVLRPTEQRR